MRYLAILSQTVDKLNERVGRAVAWIAVVMVLTQFVVVVMRYVFGLGSIMLQESVTYMHAFLFLIGAAYTLLYDGHVRVDVIYRKTSPRTRALIDLLGVIFLLLPVCGLISYFTWPYVVEAWSVLEGSKETSGIQAVFLLKSAILAFTFLVALQGVSMVLKSVLFLVGAALKETS